jgi:putative membrane protein
VSEHTSHIAHGQHGEWQRLHPRSPIARLGRIVPAIALAVVISLAHSKAENGTVEIYYLLAFGVVSIVFGFIHWMVTRWRIEGDTLRIETGLVRKDSRRLPLARIQAVDIFRPFLARLLGVSELRIRLAGSGSTDGKLAYLSELEAIELRGVLLGGGHAFDTAIFDDAVTPMAAVDTGRLIGSVVLSLVSIILIGTVVTLAVLDQIAPKTATAATGFLAVYLLSFAGVVWRRLVGQYHFEAVETTTGVRIRRGLFQTVSETIPRGRIQAVRQVEPLLWRPLGWCRLEVDIAGGTARNQRGEGTAVVRKALLPVGSHQDSWHLVVRLLGGPNPQRTAPPHRARWKAPLSFHFLSAGHDDDYAVCVTGRLNRATTWVPLEKAQSVRSVQGPLQRRFGLATVHVDVAGKRTRAEFRDRTAEEADRLVEALSNLSRQARRHDGPATPDRVALGLTPANWYPDPSGRHRWRYWNGDRWTEHVSDGTSTTVDQTGQSPAVLSESGD